VLGRSIRFHARRVPVLRALLPSRTGPTRHGVGLRRVAASQILDPLSERIAGIEARCERILAFGQRCARDAAPFLHPQLQAIKHEHRGTDGELIRPIIEITGYPEPKPALPAPGPLPIATDNQTSH
jgi:hypothetical protein